MISGEGCAKELTPDDEVLSLQSISYVNKASSRLSNKSVIFKRFYLLIFREGGREGEREGEKHRCVRETLMCKRNINQLPRMCP